MLKIKNLLNKFFKKNVADKNPINIGDTVRIYLKKPNEFGIQSETTRYTFTRISQDDYERGFIDGNIEQIRFSGPIKVYEIAVYKKTNNKNYINLYSILEEEIKDYKHLEIKEKN